MNSKTTKELFDDFFKDKDEDFIYKTRSQIDRPEVYDYENKIGKQVVDMNADELLDMIKTFGNRRKKNGSNYTINYQTFLGICVNFRAFFNYYIDNVRIIKNPFNDKKLKGVQALKQISDIKNHFSYEELLDVIHKINEKYEPERAKYLECIILLYYNGFFNATEIAELKENMIDFKLKEVNFKDRKIKVSDRCLELLQFVHNLNEIPRNNSYFAVESWCGGYFKYIIRPREVDTFQEKPLVQVISVINSRITRDINAQLDTKISYQLLYYLGFYDYMIKRIDKDVAKDIIYSVRDERKNAILMILANEYGLKSVSTTKLKNYLKYYI